MELHNPEPLPENLTEICSVIKKEILIWGLWQIPMQIGCV